MNKSVIIESMGGVGNQLFQYAFYRELLRNGTDVYLDLSWHDDVKQKFWFPYQLDVLNLPARTVTKEKYCEVTLGGLPQTFFRGKDYPIFWRKWEKDAYKYYSKYGRMKGVKLGGYWQNLKYFEDSLEDIITEVSFDDIESGNKDIELKIIESNSVSVHIRKNDYDFERFDSSCGLEYYQKAIDFFREKLDKPRFFFFSNDIEWVKNKFSHELDYYFVDSNDRYNGLGDMKLISKCKNNIISCSTFSWWSAVFNKNNEKIVIFPSGWERENRDLNLCIPDWIRL